jgi:transcriptional regulator with XRE-family HTH domain
VSSETVTNTQIFRKNLKALLDGEKVKQRELAREMGMSDANLSRIIKGVSAPSHDQLVYIAKRFRVNLNWLLLDIGEMFLPEEAELQKEEDFKEHVLANLKSTFHHIQNLGDAVRDIKAERDELRLRVELLEKKLERLDRA